MARAQSETRSDEDSQKEGRSRSCKVDRMAAEYGVTDEAATLEERWTRQDSKRYSLRDLATYFNRELLRSAMEEAGEAPLDGEIENTHRLLTDDDVSGGMRTQARNRLEHAGVDVSSLEDDFVSYQTVNRHLKHCLGIERSPTERNEGERIEAGTQRVAALRNRTIAVTQNTLEQLRAEDGFALGEFDVFVDITVACADCGTHATVRELLEDGGCECSVDSA